MKKNVGAVESYFRIGLGVLSGVAALRFAKSPFAKGVLGVAALSGLQSGIMRSCAVKQFFGLGDKSPATPDVATSTLGSSSHSSDLVASVPADGPFRAGAEGKRAAEAAL